MKKVLFITYYWPPSGGSGVQRPLKFVKYLRSFGWEPIVYTVKNGEFPETDHSLEKEIPQGITILKRNILEPFTLYKWFIGKKKDFKLVAGYANKKASGSITEKIGLWIRSNIFIPDARMLWIKPSIGFLNKYLKEHHVDAIISSGPPHSVHLIALGVKKELHIPWLADFRDPWTQIDFWEELNLTSFARKRHAALEKEVLTTADVVVCVSPVWGKGLEDIAHRIIEYISNGFDEEDVHEDIHVPPDEKFSIVHIGMMGKARNHDVFWKTIKVLCEDKDFKNDLEVKMYGKVDVTVHQSVAEHGLNELVKFYDYIPHNEIVFIQKSAQVLYLSINDTKNAMGILTGKIYEYLAVRRPILCIGPEEGEAAKIILQSKSGLVSGFYDSDKLLANIKVLYSDYKSKKPYSGGSNIDMYSRKYQTKQLADLLTNLTTE